MRARTTRRAFWMGVLFAALAVGGTVATAGACGHGRGHRAGPPEAPQGSPPGIERMLAHLDLTEEQRAEIETLREESRAAVMELQRDLQRAEHALEGELLEEEPSLARVRELAEQAGEIRTRIQVRRLEQRLTIRRLLTPEQRDRLARLRAHARRQREVQERGPRGWPGEHPSAPPERWHRGRGRGPGSRGW